jgi:hypothetical protein
MSEYTIGLNYAGCLPLLRHVFEASLKITIKDNPKTLLLFVIRDYKKNITPINEHENKIKRLMQQVWSEARKPVGEEALPLSERFDIMVYGLPKLVIKGEMHSEYVNELSRVFLDPKCIDFVFAKNNGRNKSFYIYELGELMPKIWSRIINDKDLNIMSERESLAYSRCDAALKDSYAKLAERLKELEEKLTTTRVIPNDCEEQVNLWKEETLKLFVEKAPHHFAQIYDNKFTELNQKVDELIKETSIYKKKLENDIQEELEQKRIAAEKDKEYEQLKVEYESERRRRFELERQLAEEKNRTIEDNRIMHERLEKAGQELQQFALASIKCMQELTESARRLELAFFNLIKN